MAQHGSGKNNSSNSCLELFVFLAILLINLFFEVNDAEQKYESPRSKKILTLSERLKNLDDQQLIKMLDEPGFLSSVEHKTGRNLLHIAAAINRPGFATVLIEKGLSTDKTDKRNNTPLMLALFYNSPECVELLMRYNPDLKIRSKGHNLPIHTAARHGFFKVVKESLRQGVNPEKKDFAGNTPLHIAAREGHLDIVVLLLENGADPSASGCGGWTPGDFAFNRHRDISLFLQSKGGYLSQGQLKSEFGIYDGWPLPQLDEIKSSTEGPAQKLFEAVLQNDTALLESEANSADFDVKSKAGTPLLCFALLNKKSAAAEIILDRVKLINQTDKIERSPLICATISDDEALAIKIIEKKANPSLKDMSGCSALHHAVRNRQNRLIPLLITAGADVFAINRMQQGPLHIAVEANNLQIVEFLIQNGCDVNLEDARGNTALHLAAIQGNKLMIERLLKNGADPYARNIAGKKPADLVAKEKPELHQLFKNRSEIEGINPAQKAPAEINLNLPPVKNPGAEEEL